MKPIEIKATRPAWLRTTISPDDIKYIDYSKEREHVYGNYSKVR
jgi:hypothetical protein